ncbi:MAG TPA: cupredoxin domain-containing protein [Stellaceae bacterium]|nr:cupredoxin domain-containing protein [Stellaceae bacterium]
MKLLSAVAMIGAFALAAPLAESAGAAGGKAQPVTVVATEYQFAPNRLVFRRGVRYRLHVENRGKELHEFTAPEFFRAVTAETPQALNADTTEIDVPPGTAKDFVFVPRQAGHFPLRCADHDWAGMTGDITIR